MPTTSGFGSFNAKHCTLCPEEESEDNLCSIGLKTMVDECVATPHNT